MDSYTIVKSVLVGDSNGGKSSLMLHYTTGKKVSVSSTVGVEYGSRLVKLDGGSYKLQIWDTAGQECFRSLTRNYYRGSSIVFIVFDLSSPTSYLSLSEWYRISSQEAADESVIVFVGNKADLPRKAPQDMKAVINGFCEKKYLYFETSNEIEESSLETPKEGTERISQVFEKSLEWFTQKYRPKNLTIYIKPNTAPIPTPRCSC